MLKKLTSSSKRLNVSLWKETTGKEKTIKIRVLKKGNLNFLVLCIFLQFQWWTLLSKFKRLQYKKERTPSLSVSWHTHYLASRGWARAALWRMEKNIASRYPTINWFTGWRSRTARSRTRAFTQLWLASHPAVPGWLWKVNSLYLNPEFFRPDDHFKSLTLQAAKLSGQRCMTHHHLLVSDKHHLRLGIGANTDLLSFENAFTWKNT